MLSAAELTVLTGESRNHELCNGRRNGVSVRACPIRENTEGAVESGER